MGPRIRAIAIDIDGTLVAPDEDVTPRVKRAVAQARAQGRKFRMHHQRASQWYTARRVGETVYGFKVLVDEATDLILGAHLVGPHVDETINLFALAIRRGLTAADLKGAIFAYPTGASDIAYMV